MGERGGCFELLAYYVTRIPLFIDDGSIIPLESCHSTRTCSGFQSWEYINAAPLDATSIGRSALMHGPGEMIILQAR